MIKYKINYKIAINLSLFNLDKNQKNKEFILPQIKSDYDIFNGSDAQSN